MAIINHNFNIAEKHLPLLFQIKKLYFNTIFKKLRVNIAISPSFIINGVFIPAALCSPQMRQLLNRYYIIIILSEGAVQENRHCPLLYLTSAFYFIS